LVKNRQTRRKPWKKQLTGDNPVKNRQTRRQPWEKQLTGDNPLNKDKEKILDKNNEYGDNPLEQGQGENIG
jgi:hypothetical protein